MEDQMRIYRITNVFSGEVLGWIEADSDDDAMYLASKSHGIKDKINPDVWAFHERKKR